MAVLYVLCGPPKAGKSRLRGDLYRELSRAEAEAREAGLRLRWFVQAFSPDSEGQWVADAHSLGRGAEAEDMARRVKRALREAGAFFSPEWVEKARRQLEGLCRWADVVVADLGGLPSPENEALVSGLPVIYRVAVLTLDGEDLGWRAFWRAQGLTPWYVGPYHESLARQLVHEVVDPWPVPGPEVPGVDHRLSAAMRGAAMWELRRLGAEYRYDEAVLQRAVRRYWQDARRWPEPHPAAARAAAVGAAWEMVRMQERR